MSRRPKPNPLIESGASNALTDSEWVALHVPRFKQIQRRYEAYEGFLNEALKSACRKLAPLSIVSTRAKGLASFAEKILRKRASYTDPKDPLPPIPWRA